MLGFASTSKALTDLHSYCWEVSSWFPGRTSALFLAAFESFSLGCPVLLVQCVWASLVLILLNTHGLY